MYGLLCKHKIAMAKRGRPATGKRPVIAVRVPLGWLRQIERLGDKSKVARALIGSALSVRKIKGGDGVAQIDADVARSFCELWHYSGSLPSGKNICFGWFCEGELYSVCVYGIGANAGAADFLARKTGKPVTNKNLIELRRICRVEPARTDHPLTKFIAICHRLLRRDGKRFVITYSDAARGHSGGLYRAANFQPLGRSGDEYHVVDSKGRLIHRRRAYRLGKQLGISTAEARQRLGLRPQRTKGRDRWFLAL